MEYFKTYNKLRFTLNENKKKITLNDFGVGSVYVPIIINDDLNNRNKITDNMENKNTSHQ